MNVVTVVSHKTELERALLEQIEIVLEMWGETAVDYAVDLVPVDTSNLKQSITNAVDLERRECLVGTPVEYAPYVELGTGRYYDGGRQTPWKYQDDNGKWHTTRGQRPQPFIRPAVEDHITTYQQIAEMILKS